MGPNKTNTLQRVKFYLTFIFNFISKILEMDHNEENKISSNNSDRKKSFVKAYLNGYKYGIQKWDDVYFPNYCIDLSICKSFEVKYDDTFIVGYPKSGIYTIFKLNMEFNNY